MLKKTSGIVVSYIRFKESSIIVKIFTRELGLKSYIVNGVRSATGKSKMGFYQPLTVLEMVVYDNEGRGLNRVSEVRLALPFQRIPFDFYRSGIAMFLGEVLGKSIFENYQNESLFDFLKEALSHLDSDKVMLNLFPIVFLWETSKFLGFSPKDAMSFFKEVDSQIQTTDFVAKEIEYLDIIISQSFDCTEKIPSIFRKSILDYLLHFYSHHLDNASEWRSITVLRQVIF